MCLFSLLPSCSAFAQDANPYTYKNNVKDEGIATDNNDKDTEDQEDFFDEMIYQQYGSDQSPSFNNREKINPNESDYSYGTSGGND